VKAAQLDHSQEFVTSADSYELLASVGQDLFEFCQFIGLELEPITQFVGIQPQQFFKFNSRVSFDKFCRLLELISTIADDDTIGLKYGIHSKRGGTGPFGFALNAAPNFQEMLKFFAEYAHIVVDMDRCDLHFTGSRFAIHWAYSPLITKIDQYVDYTAAATIGVFESYSRRRVEPLAAQLKRPAPANSKLHRQVFSRKLIFEATDNSFEFSAELLNIENPTSDARLFGYMRERCEDISNSMQRNKDLITLLKAELARNLVTNDIRIEKIAKRFGMSERTLQRRLAEANTNFWILLDDVRREISWGLLRETDFTIAEIGKQLGYTTQTSYSRAAKRMHGKSPKAIRAAAISKQLAFDATGSLK